MSRWLAIAAYQCQIDGTPTGSIDFQVRYFNLPNPEEVEAALRSEPIHQYKNDLGQIVSWPLRAIPNIQGILPIEQGSEITGFIADLEDLNHWAGDSAA